MKKLDKLILRSFLGPLLLTFTLSVFVLLMQFVWKYIDDMVGKGLDFSVIAELLLYASATFVPMALPIAVLFASIMTMGNFGEKYELVAMKAGGVSVSRVMLPMTVVVLMLTGVAFYFANNIMPEAMVSYRKTLYDVTRKKPAVNIRPGEYYKEIDGYVIRVGSKSQDGHTLQDVVIYDHKKGREETTVIVAKSGTMQSTMDNRYLIFSLDDGYTYTEVGGSRDVNRSHPMTAIHFSKQTISIDISSFAYSKSGEDLFKGSYQTMNVAELSVALDSLKVSLDKRYDTYQRDAEINLRTWKRYVARADEEHKVAAFNLHTRLDTIDAATREKMLNRARYIANTAVTDSRNYGDFLETDREYVNKHDIERHKKFTLSVACLLLFLIGAPFGSIVRKGGLGLPLVASVGFFVFYYVVGMIAEKAVRESAIGPGGMWVSSFVMLPIGIFLTLQATTDSSFFDAASWKRFFTRLFKSKQQ